ncbi:MAG: OmpA family protein [Bacteroidia bacterium]|nr:OmpA family protein [Bacteroidia bacterium]
MHRLSMLLISTLVMLLTYSQVCKADNNTLSIRQLTSWTNVVSFTINRQGTHIIMVMRDASTSKDGVYESYLDGNNWSSPKAIPTFNKIIADGAQVGGFFISYDEKTLYFHSNQPGGIGGMDIYYSNLTPEGWSSPMLLEGVNSESDDTYPTITPGGEELYFLRHQNLIDARQEKKEADRKSIFYAQKDAKGNFQRPQITNIALNRGWVEDVNIGSDSKTLLYTSRTEKKEPARLIYAKSFVASQWTLPENILEVDDSYDYCQPQEANGKLYFIRSNNKKRDRVGSIYTADVQRRFLLSNVISESGNVVVSSDSRPLKADIKVYNPTTMQVLARYSSYPKDGSYNLINNASDKYIVDVRADGCSYASYMLNYKEDAKQLLPKTIELFDTISLTINVYDAEIFRPLNGKVIAVRTSDKAIFRSTSSTAGQFSFRLPMGSNYNIIATSKNFNENSFLFEIEGDIIFSHFMREIPLSPQKRDVDFSIVDAETNEPIHSNINLKNLSREESINIPLDKSELPATRISLREGDAYSITIDGAKGYAFHSSSVDLNKWGEQQITIPLIPLKVGEGILLNDINFETASAELLPVSYAELDRLVKLIKENPSLRFEISAHTDNVGSADYNMRLSNMRAQSVTNYLLENGVDASVLVPKGYGMTQPKVPNDTDENRAINRRVEFILLAEEEL